MRFKSQPIHGTSEDDTAQQWFFEVGQQWTHWFQPCNWYNFGLANFAIEWDKLTGRWVLDVALLGIYVQVTYLYDRTFNEKMMSLRDQITASLQADHPGCEIKDPGGVLDQIDKEQT